MAVHVTENRCALVATSKLATGEEVASYHLEQAHRCLDWAHPAGQLLKLLQAGSCFGTTDQ